MDNIRFLLFVLFVMLGYMLWAAWQQDYGPKPPQPQSQAEAPAASAPTAAATAAPPAVTPATAPASQGKVVVRTDVIRAEIGLVGGDIQLVDLLKYPVSKDKPDVPVRLLSPEAAKLFVTQTGFLGDERIAPKHNVPWQAQATEYVMEGGQALKVPLVWRGEGVEIVKTFTFTPGSYEVKVDYQVRNTGAAPWTARQYGQLKRKRPEKNGGSAFIRTFTGVACRTADDPYEKIDFSDIADLPRDWETEGGWCAMVQHYFLAAWLPPQDQINHFYTKALPEEVYLVGSYSPEYRVNPGESRHFGARFYIGPKLQDVLETVAPGLELTVDYGIFTFIAEPIFWLLSWFHKFFGNWGWAIIATTFIIKAIFFPLSAASYKSMAKMRKLQPKMQLLKERFGEDKQKFQQALMQLYREEKVNPLGGCLPILVQIPVFISLYWVLVESVELRQAEFILWLNDLTSKDPYFILPALMGLTMWIQQKLSPPPTDPVQAQVMKMFPLIFTVFFAFFPAGLVLYWVVNNTLSIVQQWWINKQIEGSAEA
ncbi:YidC/Oxa1 family membrane protein insertase [Methylomarinovum caldicuralii]|uniref:Membrane protein insertase YidC n=1 Tax=Methylomarinovum caldicuralii TaxID=438856 RepID=A0AAU9C5M0_9GAMM|nr:membrane protein insertase YidC [Methylomarinovum caldicuralii]BCX83038.1 YidC/Oxa1 family membrane protein insertase [Methylomarinovum caldicuralii]